ncbi:MAG: ABC transporter ATP-binding protein [Bacteroidota bacterium]
MLLETINLQKTYRHHDGLIHALDGLNLRLEQGSFTTITGRSGSGKTTLLLMLGGLIRPSAGSILLDGKKLEAVSERELADCRKKHFGFVMQNFSLVPYLTARQNVMLPLSLSGKKKEEQLRLSSEVLDMVGLSDRLSHLPRELSAGQQQRVAIARALVNKPSMILADEPTGNLDPALSLEILDFLKTINEDHKISILMVTHSPMAANYGHRIIKLINGKEEIL